MRAAADAAWVKGVETCTRYFWQQSKSFGLYTMFYAENRDQIQLFEPNMRSTVLL
jgi:hypothetical protein